MLELTGQNFSKGINLIHNQEKEVTQASSYKNQQQHTDVFDSAHFQLQCWLSWLVEKTEL